MDTVLRKFFRCGTTAVLALVSGEVPISQVAGPAAVNSALAGSDIVMVAAGATSLDYWLMSQPAIKKPEQLKGGSVAISRFGTASDFVARYALDKIGLTPGRTSQSYKLEACLIDWEQFSRERSKPRFSILRQLRRTKERAEHPR